jgi:hypothetical protein
MAKTVIIARTVVVTDPLARANARTTLAGPGAPAGITACRERDDSIELAFDDQRTGAALIDALIAVATTFVPARVGAVDNVAAATAIAARGLHDPELDTSRIIETYLP